MNWKTLLMAIALALAAGGVVSAQQTNKTDYGYFRIIPDRNIFNPNRYPRRTGARRPESTRGPVVDAFALVGTMTYQKGTFAFFDGSNSDYQKVLERDGTIAGFKITAIESNGVLLAVGDKPVTMKIGEQMRRDTETGWQLVKDGSDLPVERTTEAASNTAPAAVAPAPAAASEDSPDQNDVLKKLMQKREQELQ